MEQLSPQVMHKLVFTILVHGLPDAQTAVALDVLGEALDSPNAMVRELAIVAVAELQVPPARRVGVIARGLKDPSARVRRRAARVLGDFGLSAPVGPADARGRAAGLGHERPPRLRRDDRPARAGRAHRRRGPGRPCSPSRTPASASWRRRR